MVDFKKHRLAMLAILALFWMIAIGLRLFTLQILRYADLSHRARHQQEQTLEIAPHRGAILDRKNHELAMSVLKDSVFAAPREMGDLDSAVTLLAPMLQVDGPALRARLQANAGKSFVWVKRRVEPDEAERVKALNLRGVYQEKEPQRVYPKHELAAQVVGFVTTDQHGVAGLEYRYNHEMEGRPGQVLVQADAHHKSFWRHVKSQAAPGENLVLTLDERIQQIAERELAAAMERTHAQAGTVLVLDSNTSEILAMANLPTFDPNARQDVPPEVWLNRSVNSIYEPGSTMKIITIASALEEGLTTPDEVIDCQMGAINVFGRIVHDHKKFGMLTTSQIMAVSSDVGSIKLGLRVGNERMYRYIRAFGLGEKTGVELPGEQIGIARRPESWNKSSMGSIAMGQELAATPLQMAEATTVIATGGIWNRPHILRQAPKPADPKSVSTVMAAATESRRVVSPETALKVRNMLELVMTNGTGRTARLNGYTSGGKSGTAQKYDPAIGTFSPTNYIASFIGFAPVTRPAITIAVILDSPVGAHHGGEVSGPVFKRVAEQVLSYLEVTPDLPGDHPVKAEKIDPEQLRDSADAVVEPEQAPAQPVVEGTAVVDLGGSLVAPDFSGKNMRAVAEMALLRGLEVNLVGTGVARQQSPAPGQPLPPGRRITVKFSR